MRPCEDKLGSQVASSEEFLELTNYKAFTSSPWMVIMHMLKTLQSDLTLVNKLE